MVTKDYSKSRMRENRTYGSVRGGQSNLIPSTRLTALRAEGCGGALWAHIEKRGAAGADIKKAPKAAANPGPNPGSPGRRPGGCLNPNAIGA